MAALLHLLQQHPHPLLHPRHHRRRLQQRAAAQRAARDRAVLLRRPGPRPPGTPRLRARSRQPLMPGPLARRRQRARCRQRGRYRAPSAASTRAPHAAWTRASPGRDQTHALHAASTEPKKGLSLSPSVPPSLRPSVPLSLILSLPPSSSPPSLPPSLLPSLLPSVPPSLLLSPSPTSLSVMFSLSLSLCERASVCACCRPVPCPPRLAVDRSRLQTYLAEVSRDKDHVFLVRHASLWTGLDSRPISPRSDGSRLKPWRSGSRWV